MIQGREGKGREGKGREGKGQRARVNVIIQGEVVYICINSAAASCVNQNLYKNRGYFSLTRLLRCFCINFY